MGEIQELITRLSVEVKRAEEHKAYHMRLAEYWSLQVESVNKSIEALYRIIAET